MGKSQSKQFNKIKKQCLKMRINDMTIKEIQAVLADKGINWSYDKIKNCTRVSRNPQVKKAYERRKENKSNNKIEKKLGKTERKPPYEKTESGYVIYYGKNQKLVTNTEELEKAFSLFCLAGLTMSSSAMRMRWSRKEFFAAKSAFEITKESIPLLPETIDGLSVDEMSEKVRIIKKKYAIQKIHENTIKDIERDNKKLREIDYYWGQALDRLNTISAKPFNIKAIKQKDDIQRVIAIADEHSGSLVSTPWNNYNIEIMKERFKKTTEAVLKLTDPCTLHIVELGDSAAGILHSSILQESENVIDSIFHVTECLIEMILTLLKHSYKIKFLKVTGNHGAVFSDPKARTQAANFERLVTWAIQLKLKNFKNFEVINPICNLGLLKFFDYSVICTHGTQGGLKNISGLEKFFKNDNVKEVLAAHIHHQKSENFGNVTVYHLPSFIGLDSYALSKGLYSEPGCRLIEYNEDGRQCEHYIKL